MSRKERAVLTGNRFEAAVSASRTRVDLKDRRDGKTIVLLDRGDVEEMRDLAIELLEMMGPK